MRSISLRAVVLGSVLVAGCSRGDDLPGTTRSLASPIAFGTTDTTHTAVVALLVPDGSGSYTACSGTVVQLRAGAGYVLTAAHCCNGTSPPTVVVMANDYSASVVYVSGGTPAPPAYAVTAGSVYYDSMYTGTDHDFCMLRFAAPSTTAVIPVAMPGSDGLADAVSVEHVGFGVTDTNVNNTARRHGSDTVDRGLTTTTLSYSQGGAARTPGICDGDWGGPTLLPAGAPQASQHVVGVTSHGSTSTCSAAGVGVSSRVTSETGAGGFITNYLNDMPSGTHAGAMIRSCNACITSAETGTCAFETNDCTSDPNCVNLRNCKGACHDPACVTACESAAGASAVAELNAIDRCICTRGCVSECAVECSAPPSDAGVPTDAGDPMDAGEDASSTSDGSAPDADTDASTGADSSSPDAREIDAAAHDSGSDAAIGSDPSADAGTGVTHSGCSVAGWGAANRDASGRALVTLLIGAAVARVSRSRRRGHRASNSVR